MFMSLKQRNPLSLAMLAVAISCLAGCQPDDTTSEASAPPVEVVTVQDREAQDKASQHFWQQGSRSFIAAAKSAATLRDSIVEFLQDSSEESLLKLRQQWHTAHNQYSASAVFRALSDSNPALFESLRDANFRIDAHPIQPGYLDSFDVYAHSGIVNDIAVPITAAAIRAQHGFSDDTDVSTGFHALGYLIFGEDGQRPLADLQAQTSLSDEQKSNGLKIIDLSQNRRRSLVKLISELLLDDIRELQTQWQLETGALQQSYTALAPDSRLQLIRSSAIVSLNAELQSFKQGQIDAAERHNVFAGNDQQRTLAAVNGIKDNIDETVLKQIYSTEAAAEWQRYLQESIDSISAAEKPADK
jgi:putative iron-regulated protein